MSQPSAPGVVSELECLDRSELIARAAKMKWFHAIDFGEGQSSGRFPPGTPQNVTLYGVMDLLQHVDVAGMDCIDIGTANGLVAFNLKMRGARMVVATDVGGLSYPFGIARQLLGLDVEYSSFTHLGNIAAKFAPESFDLLNCSGVMYHAINPFECIIQPRRLLKRGGILALETAYNPENQHPTIELNTETECLHELSTYWLPSKSAVFGMLKLAGFETLAVRTIKNPDRLAVIARLVAFDELSNRSEFLRRLHGAGIYDPTFPPTPETRSSISYDGPRDDVELDWKTYQPNFPPHPTKVQRGLGETSWLSKTSNY